MSDPSEPQSSATAPLEAATSAPETLGAASDLLELQGKAIISLSEDAQFNAPPNLDDIATESTSGQHQGESDLLKRAKQGEIEALRQLLNHELAVHRAELADIEFRGERLQLTISGREVPLQDAVEGFIKEWIVQLGLVRVQKVELYGQKEDCELPFWRSEFNPAELELTTPRQKPPEIKPITFAFQTTNAITASPQSEPVVNPIGASIAATHDAKTEELDAVVPNKSSWNDVNPLPETADMRAKPTQLATTLIAAQSSDLPLFTEKQANREPFAAAHSSTASDLEQAKPELKQIVENAATASKRKVVEAFLARYEAGERSFTKIDLSEADLSGINITLADLQEAQLIWANLQDASLYHVNLLGAKLRHANLKGAKLRSANLRGADFLNADLSETDLSWSNLTGANLTGANLTDANLQNAVLDNVIMPDGTRLD